MSKMFLPIVAVWILLADVTCQQNVSPHCCDSGTDEANGEIVKCVEQKKGPACDKHFYILELKDGKKICIKPGSNWLKQKRDTENLTCIPSDGHHQQKLHVAAKPKKKH